MSAECRVVFALGARLHMSAAAVEQLSTREIAAWVEFFSAAAAASAPDDGAVDLSTLSREQRRALFHHG